jgi:hypothetical protein
VTKRRQKDVAAHIRLGEPLADITHEECSRVRSRCDAHLADVAFDEARSETTERHDAILFPFVLVDEKSALREIDVGHVETHELADAQRRRVDRFEDRAIADRLADHRAGSPRGAAALRLA